MTAPASRLSPVRGTLTASWTGDGHPHGFGHDPAWAPAPRGSTVTGTRTGPSEAAEVLA